MPLVTATPTGLQNGSIITQFTDTTNTSTVTYTYPTAQTGLVIENSGEYDIFVTVGNVTNKQIRVDTKYQYDGSFTSFSIRSDVNSQEFIATSIIAAVVGSVKQVNGIAPDTNGNITIPVPQVDTSTLATKTEVNAVASGSPKGVYATVSALQTAFSTGNSNIYLVTGNVNEVDTLNVTSAPTTPGNVTVTLNGVATNIAVTSGVKEVASLTVSAIPTTAGNVTVTLNGVATNIAVDPATDTTTDLVATKIRNATYSTGAVTGGSASTVTFTAAAVGTKTDATYSAGSTGATGTMSTTTQGVDADTTTSVATKIRGTAFSGWTTGGSGTAVTFTSTTGGVKTSPSYSAGSTGATGTMAVTTAGVDIDGKWYYWNGSAWIAGEIYQSTGLSDGIVSFQKLEPNLKQVFDVIEYDVLDTVSSGSQSNGGSNYYIVPKYVIPKNKTVKKALLYANVATNVEISFWHGTAPNLTMVSKGTYPVIIGLNEIPINYKTVQDSYIGINPEVTGGITFNTEGSSYYSGYYHFVSTNIDVGTPTTFSNGDFPTANFNLKLTLNDDVKISVIQKDIKDLQNNTFLQVKGKKFACFGDSITSNDVSAIGTMVSTQLQTALVGNFAEGFATCSDFQTSGSTISFVSPADAYIGINVLSNQIRRMLQRTTALGSQVTWTHPFNGAFSIDTSFGTGLGYTTDIPDIIYIAIGTNDGYDSETSIFDDSDTIFSQSYSALTRKGIASALRWAIETLQSAYPNVQIFVASPLQTDTAMTHMSSTNNKLKRDIIQKVCQFCSVYFIDSFNESGFSRLIAHSNGGIHPTEPWKTNIAKFVSNRINDKFVQH